jgi:hypothetical protein
MTRIEERDEALVPVCGAGLISWKVLRWLRGAERFGVQFRVVGGRLEHEAERRALNEWHAKYFDKLMVVQDADAELTRLYHERQAAWSAYGHAVGPSDDDEETDE